MQIKYTFKHMQALKSIEDYAQDRIEKIEKFSMHKDMHASFIFSVQREDQTAEINVDYGGHHYTATAKDPTLYTAIDMAVEKLEHQLLKEKDKITSHHKFDLSNEGYLRQELAAQARAQAGEAQEQVLKKGMRNS